MLRVPHVLNIQYYDIKHHMQCSCSITMKEKYRNTNSSSPHLQIQCFDIDMEHVV